MESHVHALELGAPADFEAYTVSLGDDDYALFVFAMPQAALPDVLTTIECEIANAVIDGLSNSAIAQARGRSRHTIANQLRGIYKKLGVTGRNALIAHCNRLAA